MDSDRTMLRLMGSRRLRRAGDHARDACRWSEAAGLYRRYLARRPDDFAIHVQLGHVLAAAGEPDEAERAYAAAARMRADLAGHADLLLCWGHMRRDMGDRAGARTLYARSLACDGNGHAAVALREMEPEDMTEPEPPAPAEAGRIEHVRDRTIEGVLWTAGTSGPLGVEFRCGDAVAGRARAAGSDAGGIIRFKALIQAAPGALVSARRLPDGLPLAGSPFRLAEPIEAGAEPPFAWSARCEIVKPFAMQDGDEVALFVTRSATGSLKPHVAEHLRALRRERVAVLLIAMVDRPLDLDEAVLAIVAGAIVRENIGDDFAGWAHAARLYPDVYGAAVLYLLNDSISAPPADAFRRMIARVRGSRADLIGLTESMEYRRHLQSYFLAVKPGLLCSYAFQHFLGGVRLLDDEDAAIRGCELRFSPEMEASGAVTEVLFPSAMPLNPMLFDWRRLIADAFPFMKILPLRGRLPEVDLEGWREVLDEARFDLDLIDRTIRACEQAVPLNPDPRLTTRPRAVAAIAGRAAQRLKVAYYGPWNCDNGPGAAARGVLAALRRTGVQLNINPVSRPFHIHRPLAPPVDMIDFAGPADIAIIHLNPDSWHLLTETQRGDMAAAGKRIGYWVREMAHLPESWWPGFGEVDRIWAPSRYCADLFEAQDGAPVDIIPHAVPVLPRPPGVTDRALLGLAGTQRIILYMFDGSSCLVRQNPAALVRAFTDSGLGRSGWTLVLKMKHLLDRQGDGLALRELIARSPGVMLIDRVMAAQPMAGLLALADIYASPHCSEGFGLTIAEAMAAGKPVVATDFGGSTDFLDDMTGYPVSGKPWMLDRDHGACTAGGAWAAIDEAALARTLVEAAAAIDRGDDRIGAAARARSAAQLSYDAVAALIVESLEATAADRRRYEPMRSIRPGLLAAIPIERSDFGRRFRAIALAADGSLPPDLSEIADHAPGGEEWLVLAPSGSLLHPLLGAIVSDHAERRPDAAIFFADDLAVQADHAIDQLRLKPAFDPVLLVAQDYIGAPLIVRAAALAELGGLRRTAGTALLDDLLLRAHAAGLSIARICEVLLVHPGRRCRAAVEDRRVVLAEAPALAGHDIVDGMAPGTLMLRRRFADADMPPVSILIPTRRALRAEDGVAHVERLLEDIAKADWPPDRLRVIVGDDISGEPCWAEASAWPFSLMRIETPRAAGEPFNYAAKMNRLWRAAGTEHLIFLNDDVRATGGQWLKALMTFAVDPGVGGVGARLIYPDGRLQHAGLAPFGPAASHVWVKRKRPEGTYQEWARVQRQWSMVTGAVFATRRSTMEVLDGFDERFTVEFNDTDLCLRMGMLGYRIVCTPDAEMIHVEKSSRGDAPAAGDQFARFLSRWKGWLAEDPCWHPGLRLDRIDMTPADDPHAWYM